MMEKTNRKSNKTFNALFWFRTGVPSNAELQCKHLTNSIFYILPYPIFSFKELLSLKSKIIIISTAVCATRNKVGLTLLNVTKFAQVHNNTKQVKVLPH